MPPDPYKLQCAMPAKIVRTMIPPPPPPTLKRVCVCVCVCVCTYVHMCVRERERGGEERVFAHMLVHIHILVETLPFEALQPIGLQAILAQTFPHNTHLPL